ncbi:hypothetical protein [Thalassobellus suaedae]|uniref:Uncharacterized protein n=1 Tax=Thalassobellus suaedae TaxID=3074124 RepID=A0ABY9XZJ9_9FLAO|nr:hypothetical protein RHP49_09985 [Flavobacteriaceae bacterium HL-DH10]
MKFKRALKITLLIICVLHTGFVIALMYFVLLVEKESFEYSMLIPLFMIITGVLSISYNFKTLKLYNPKIEIIVFKDAVLWVGNLLFALSQILTSLYLVYLTFNHHNQNTQFYMAFSICFVMLVLGLCLIIEAHNLYKRILISNKDLYKRTIDDIKGLDENLD